MRVWNIYELSYSYWKSVWYLLYTYRSLFCVSFMISMNFYQRTIMSNKFFWKLLYFCYIWNDTRINYPSTFTSVQCIKRGKKWIKKVKEKNVKKSYSWSRKNAKKEKQKKKKKRRKVSLNIVLILVFLFRWFSSFFSFVLLFILSTMIEYRSLIELTNVYYSNILTSHMLVVYREKTHPC